MTAAHNVMAFAEFVKSKGLRMSELSPTRAKVLRLEMEQSLKGRASTVLTSVSSVARARMGIRVVPLEQVRKNRDVCLSCDQLEKLKNGDRICSKCGCHAQMLEAKWADATQRCPIKRWDNTKVSEDIDAS